MGRRGAYPRGAPTALRSGQVLLATRACNTPIHLRMPRAAGLAPYRLLPPLTAPYLCPPYLHVCPLRVAYTDELKALLAEAGAGRDVHTLPALADKLKAAAPSGKLSRRSTTAPTACNFAAFACGLLSRARRQGRATQRLRLLYAAVPLCAAGCRVLSELLPATLDRCRAAKTDGELACLLAANIASGAAHLDVWRACRPGAAAAGRASSHGSRASGGPLHASQLPHTGSHAYHAPRSDARLAPAQRAEPWPPTRRP